jgi:hypothetical protein
MSLKQYILNRENRVHIDRNEEFIYFPVNKAMQTSMGNGELKDRLVKYKYEPELWNELFNKIDIDTIYKFGITRNPISKFESAYNYLKKCKRNQLGINKNVNINEFVKNTFINYENPYLLNRHFERQYESFFFTSGDNKLIVNDLYKMESNDDLDNMCKKLHLDRDKLIHINKTNHEERLTKESIEILSKIYSNDFKYLNYSIK